MTEARRRAYLEAMGYDVWVSRSAEPVSGRLVVGPGRGSTLLVCPEPGHSATRIAADIARAAGEEPVWAWPDPEGFPDRPDLEQAVRDGLFTRIILFGETVKEQLMTGESGDIVASSSVFVAEDPDILAVSGEARRALWKMLRGGS